MRTPSRLRVPQLELFRPAPITPTIAPDVSRKVVHLLACLLCEHAQQARPTSPGRGRQEVGHE